MTEAKRIRTNKTALGIVFSVLIVVVAGCHSTREGRVIPLTAHQAESLLRDHRGNPQFVVLDIRTPAEFAQGHIQGAVLLDYYRTDFRDQLKALDRSKAYLIYCRSGNRSGRTMKMVADLGFNKIYHLKNGILGWNGNKLPVMRP